MALRFLNPAIFRKSPWKNDLNIHIERLKAAGVVSKLTRDATPSAKPAPNASMAKPLTFNHLKSSLALLAAGLILATLAFLCELLSGRPCLSKNISRRHEGTVA